MFHLGSYSTLADWGGHLYCADLNLPWEPSLVTASESAITSLAWDATGTRFVCGELSGQVSVWEMEDDSISDWKLLATNRYNHERFIAAKFFLKSRPVSLNPDKIDSLIYTEKFSSDGPSWSRSGLDGCVLVSATGLLVTIAFTADQVIIPYPVADQRNDNSISGTGARVQGGVRRRGEEEDRSRRPGHHQGGPHGPGHQRQ